METISWNDFIRYNDIYNYRLTNVLDSNQMPVDRINLDIYPQNRGISSAITYADDDDACIWPLVELWNQQSDAPVSNFDHSIFYSTGTEEVSAASTITTLSAATGTLRPLEDCDIYDDPSAVVTHTVEDYVLHTVSITPDLSPIVALSSILTTMTDEQLERTAQRYLELSPSTENEPHQIYDDEDELYGMPEIEGVTVDFFEVGKQFYLSHTPSNKFTVVNTDGTPVHSVQCSNSYCLQWWRIAHNQGKEGAPFLNTRDVVSCQRN